MKGLHTIVGLLAGGMILTAGPTWADIRGIAGPLAAFGTNDNSSDKWGAATGTIYIDEGGTLRRYIWGGSLCQYRDLNHTQQLLLVEALHSRVFVIPFYKVGSGGSRCLLSFVFAPNESDLPNLDQ